MISHASTNLIGHSRRLSPPHYTGSSKVVASLRQAGVGKRLMMMLKTQRNQPGFLKDPPDASAVILPDMVNPGIPTCSLIFFFYYVFFLWRGRGHFLEGPTPQCLPSRGPPVTPLERLKSIHLLLQATGENNAYTFHLVSRLFPGTQL